jgi:hypothetical protein
MSTYQSYVGRSHIDHINSQVSPPLAGGDQGEGNLIGCNSILFTLTPALSRQGRGRFLKFCEIIKHEFRNRGKQQWVNS